LYPSIGTMNLCLVTIALCGVVAFESAVAERSSSFFDELAVKYAPRLRFDMKAGTEFCFPSDAQQYYDQRKSGNTDRVCNMDYNSVMNGVVPSYYHYQVCGYHLHISYWFFYGYQHDCNCCKGQRDAWWESIVVKVRDFDLNERLHEVRFSQKDGWYTRIPGRYEMVVNTTHPVAYVGKTNHGNYHDDGGTGTCCYYEDFRDPHEVDQHMDTWQHLRHINGSEVWMNDSDTAVWNNIQSPPFRSDWDLCSLNSCTGSGLIICGTCGCYKSDTGEGPF